MNTYEVLNLLCEMARIKKEDADDYYPVCFAAVKKILSMISDKADKNDKRLVYAAAALANYHVTLLKNLSADEMPDSLEVGDIRISTDKNAVCDSAKRLYEEALSCIADLIPDRNFFFRGV